MKSWMKTLLKLAVTCLAFYLVFRKVSWTEVRGTLADLQPGWLILAFLLYNLSQGISSLRLLGFYRDIDVPVSRRQNLLIYYRAMFYGLFLPGGVSGDAYKVLTLQKQYARPYRALIIATISDRAVGLAMLGSILAFLTMLAGAYLEVPITGWRFWLALAVLAGWILVVWVSTKLAKPHTRQIPRAALFSFIVQSMQLIAFFLILHAMGIPSAQWIRYAVLFYAGSILSSLPISMGGMGIREWTMVTGSAMFGLHSPAAFTASFTFFLVSSISALLGSFTPNWTSASAQKSPLQQ
jgi:uncharacterized membrane protein YbhN (UPF0104 family)